MKTLLDCRQYVEKCLNNRSSECMKQEKGFIAINKLWILDCNAVFIVIYQDRYENTKTFH